MKLWKTSKSSKKTKMTEYTEYTEEDNTIGHTPEPAVLNFSWGLTLTTLFTSQPTFSNTATTLQILKNQDLKIQH